MREVNASFSAAIALDMVRVAELYIFDLANGSTFRYTTHTKNITWDSGNNIYTSIPIERGGVVFNSNSEFDSVTITLANISGDLADELMKNTLDGMKVTIKRILWDDTYASDKEITIFKGYANIEFNRKELTLVCKPMYDTLNLQVPRRVYTEPCNYRLFDYNCKLIQNQYSYAGTASSGSRTTLVDTTRGTVYRVAFDAGDSSNPIEIGDTITGQDGAGTGVVVQIIYITAATGFLWYVEQAGVNFVDDEELQDADIDSVYCNGAPVEDLDFYILGEVEILTATNASNVGQRRPVLSNSANTVTFLWPLPDEVSNGDTYNIFPSCGKTADNCRNRFDNENNFFGFLYIPKQEEAVM